jgi:hypothetical protein
MYLFQLKLAVKECVVVGEKDEETGISNLESLASCIKRKGRGMRGQ